MKLLSCPVLPRLAAIAVMLWVTMLPTRADIINQLPSPTRNGAPPVPEPAGPILAGVAGIAFLLRRRRPLRLK